MAFALAECLDVIYIYQALDGVSSGDEVSNPWYYFSNKMILEGEIKDAKMSSFSSDFQTLIKH